MCISVWLHVCLCEDVSSWSYGQLLAVKWMLGTEPRSSGKAVSVLNLSHLSSSKPVNILTSVHKSLPLIEEQEQLSCWILGEGELGFFMGLAPGTLTSPWPKSRYSGQCKLESMGYYKKKLKMTQNWEYMGRYSCSDLEGVKGRKQGVIMIKTH